MVKITNTVKNFKEMISLIMCGSKYPVFDSIDLIVEDGKISVDSTESTRSVVTKQDYYGFTIVDSGIIPIDTVQIFEALKLFSDDDELSLLYENNTIVLNIYSDEKTDTIKFPTINVVNTPSGMEFTENSVMVGEKLMTFDAIADINSKYLKEQIRRSTYVNTFQSYKIAISEGTGITLSVGDIAGLETSSTTTIKSDVIGSATSSYIHGYSDIMSAISGNINIQLGENKPMLITKNTEDYNIQYLLAPGFEQN